MKAITETKENLVFLPLDQIIDHAEVRKTSRPLDMKWVGELVTNIGAVGLDVPLIVWEDPSATVEVEGDDGNTSTIRPSFLIAGNHRREALRKLAKSQPGVYKKWFLRGIPCIFRQGTLKDALCAQLRENAARKDPTAAEMLPLMIRLRDEFKMKGLHIANAIGKSTSYVSQVFDIEDALGEEGVKEVVEGNVSAKNAMKAAKKVKDAKKEGKDVDVDEAIAEAKTETAKMKETGRERAEKKMSLPKLWAMFKSLPSMGVGKRLDLLERMVRYSVGELATLPPELKKASTEK